MELRLKTDRRAIQEGSAISRAHFRKRTSHHWLAHPGLSNMVRRRLLVVVGEKEGRRGEEIESKSTLDLNLEGFWNVFQVSTTTYKVGLRLIIYSARGGGQPNFEG